MNYAEIFKTVRKRKEMNQEDFAQLLGVSSTHISLLETNKRKPSNALMDKLSYESRVPVPVLMFFGLTEQDVLYDKREAFKLLKPGIDSMITNLFLNDVRP